MTAALNVGVASAVAMAGALLVAGGQVHQAVAGWALALVNGLAGWFIDRRTVGRDGERSVLTGLAAHAVRAMGLLLVVVAVRWRMGRDCESFVVATMVAYFIFLFAEIARLARLGR